LPNVFAPIGLYDLPLVGGGSLLHGFGIRELNPKWRLTGNVVGGPVRYQKKRQEEQGVYY